MKRIAVLPLLLLLSATLRAEPPSEISVDIKPDHNDYVLGERIRAVADVANLSPDTIRVGGKGAPDSFFVEIYRSPSMQQFEGGAGQTFVAPFSLKPNEGQKLEVFLGDNYAFTLPGRYLAKPVLVHRGVRYEGRYRAFDLVTGIRLTGAVQMFKNHDGLRREFELVKWSRQNHDNIFLKTKDTGLETRTWHTVDLGKMMNIARPTVSILPGGEVIVLHRYDSDNFLRSEFWSVPDGLEFHSRQLVQDPETAGSNRVREIYRESGGVKPKENPWWKFW